MDAWQLQDAKNKFSEVVERARTVGPQLVTRRGVEAVVIVSAEEYAKMSRPGKGLLEFMRESPMVGADLDLDRSRDVSRDVEL